MIDRYARAEMKQIWDESARYLYWLKVENAASEQMARERLFSRKQWVEIQKGYQKIFRQGGISPKFIQRREAITHHDVIAFVEEVSQKMGSVGRFVHFGLTSSDVVDTALSLQIQDAGALLIKDIQILLKLLESKSRKFKNQVCMGRTHGRFAEPTTFGLKFLGWASEWKRNLVRLEKALDQLRYGKLSGPVGTCNYWGTDFEEKVMKRLNLRVEPISTQVIPRDRHAELAFCFAICGASLERMALEVRNLQRSEVSEVFEGFAQGQKGSSAMPHKRNPIAAENICGCSRLLRTYLHAFLENISLWHERDISHSSVERVLFPDGFILLDYALHRMIRLITNLEVDTHVLRENLIKAGPMVHSGRILLALIQKGNSREQAYQWIQQCAFASKNKKEGEFQKELLRHPEIQKHLTPKEVKELIDLKKNLKNIPQIYLRVMR